MLRFIERLLGLGPDDDDDGPHDPAAELNMRAAFRQEAAKRQAVRASLDRKARVRSTSCGVFLDVEAGDVIHTVPLTPDEAETLGLRLEIEAGGLLRGLS